MAEVEYECCVCFEDFPLSQGTICCWEHFVCGGCAVEVFNRSLKNINEFPASCCTAKEWHVGQFEDVLQDDRVDKNFRSEYHLRMEAHHTPLALKTYCTNPECSRFLRRETFREGPDYSAAYCKDCNIKVCVGCKAEFERPGKHI
ncbi:hypothetical protein EJ04DRAFT_527882 [Polyplosphaeria fusca]|uniref:IBR domain-containing protein n=1 Tax=Polyplosphaeria fusca TaxID=682080 RepID=A0A9P4QN06_9PLEO|nr:hypothetical protein EJ04DRAFT_527882 [Polyplosphaeria fusca]